MARENLVEASPRSYIGRVQGNARLLKKEKSEAVWRETVRGGGSGDPHGTPREPCDLKNREKERGNGGVRERRHASSDSRCNGPRHHFTWQKKWTTGRETCRHRFRARWTGNGEHQAAVFCRRLLLMSKSIEQKNGRLGLKKGGDR